MIVFVLWYLGQLVAAFTQATAAECPPDFALARGARPFGRFECVRAEGPNEADTLRETGFLVGRVWCKPPTTIATVVDFRHVECRRYASR